MSLKQWFYVGSSILILSLVSAASWGADIQLGANVNTGLVKLDAKDEFPDAKNNRLVRAAGRGDTDDIEAAVREGADVNAISAIRRVSPLMWAVMADKSDSIRTLMRLGANPSYVVSNLSTPERDPRQSLNQESALTTAIFNRKTAALKLLLEGGANPNQVGTVSHTTPLFMASNEALKGEIGEMFMLMLKHGADVNLQISPGDNLLKDLITTGKFATAVFIIEKGADVHSLNKKEKYPWCDDFYALLKSGQLQEQPGDFYEEHYGAYQLFRITGADGKGGDAISKKLRQLFIDRGVKLMTWDSINVAQRGNKYDEDKIAILKEENVPEEIVQGIIRLNKRSEAKLSESYLKNGRNDWPRFAEWLEKEWLLAKNK
jgi:ankyrin repeat protein